MLNKKEVDKFAGAFLLKGRRDGFGRLVVSRCSVNLSTSPVGINIFICLAQSYMPPKKPLHHKDLSLPYINKVYDPDLNVPLLLIVLHSRWKRKKKKRREGNSGQAVDQHRYEFVFVVWHHERVHKSIDFSYPFSALCSKLWYRAVITFKFCPRWKLTSFMFFSFDLKRRAWFTDAMRTFKEMKSFKPALLVKCSLHLSPDKTPVTQMLFSVTGVIHETAKSS